jgi:SAM-dependent MidA family methyltransferase
LPADFVIQAIRERGPITVAALMDLALYHPQSGYYARSPRRSGRTGDFFTSVDVGSLFGRLLEAQLNEMAAILGGGAPDACAFDLVEVGAGNGQLSADVLHAAKRRHPDFYDGLRLHLVEASTSARTAHAETLSDTAERIASSSECLPASFEGALVANELLDALPVHQVVMRPEGLREVYVDLATGPQSGQTLVMVEGPPSTPRLASYFDHLNVALEPGWRAEVNLRAIDWIRDAAGRLRRGFMLLIDYGHEARELYSAGHTQGTLTSFSRHTSRGSDNLPAWLDGVGETDLTAHVDFTSVRAAAEREGLVTLGLLDQTYFILGLVERGLIDSLDDLKDRLALKTLLLPGGLGSTMKVLVLAKDVGTPSLACCSYRIRTT